MNSPAGPAFARSTPSHPISIKTTTKDMVMTAFRDLSSFENKRKGVSIIAVKNYMKNVWNADMNARQLAFFKKTVTKLAEDGVLVQTTGTGTLTGSYKLKEVKQKKSPRRKPSAKATDVARKLPIGESKKVAGGSKKVVEDTKKVVAGKSKNTNGSKVANQSIDKGKKRGETKKTTGVGTPAGTSKTMVVKEKKKSDVVGKKTILDKVKAVDATKTISPKRKRLLKTRPSLLVKKTRVSFNGIAVKERRAKRAASKLATVSNGNE